MEDDLKNFLIETEYCNFKYHSIAKLAKEINGGYTNNTDKSVAAFYWVRDNIRYSFGLWDKKASDVLQQEYGMCTNKAVLLTSLLRALGIPAGFIVLKVKGQEYFGPITPGVLKDYIEKISTHIHTCVFLKNRWLFIDPSVDKELADKTSYFNYTTELIDWDGSDNGKETIKSEHILNSSNPLFNIDDKLKRRPRKTTFILFKLGNLYLDFLRNNNQKLGGDIDTIFKKWLRDKHFIYYCLYILLYYYKRIRK